MSDELWNAIQHMDLGREEPELYIPYHAYVGALASNRLSLLGRILNPQTQSVERAILELPYQWGLGTQVHGRILDDRCFQVRFRSEIDLLNGIRRAPWVFNEWFIALQRWEDFPTEDFLTFIDVWVQIKGIPLPYVSERTVEIIASTLGEVVAMDFNEETTSQITFIRVKVRMDFTEPLRFFRRVRFASRERAMIGFEYEKLQRVCTNCCRVNHQVSHCPYVMHQEEMDNEPDVLVSPERYDDEDSLNQEDHGRHSQSSVISSFSSLTPTSLNAPPVVNWNDNMIGNIPHRFPSTLVSSSHTVSDGYLAASEWRPKDQVSYEVGESSKRKKGKQVLELSERSIRQRRMGSGIRFYPVNGENP
ncbi:unnamed protein product [Arabidopsis thaliana]|uniref:Ta11-like non-LTR retroelement protein n=1 Tax=Arabidopsis thaliana TaxID=3702 RepID=A0A654G6C1_ARATH|nr:unnamed protein product [Arabidopsis thaliana]